MDKMLGTQRFSFRIASAAILTAVTVLLTIAVRIPIAPTRGYINFGDVAVFFTALTFGPFAAFIAGGTGTAIADILSGYSQWAVFSFLIHGFQGLAAGFIFNAVCFKNIKWGTTCSGILVFIVGTVIMAGGYFAAGSLLAGPGAAITEIPINVIQNGAGVAGGYFLSFSVKKAYPPVVNFRW